MNEMANRDRQIRLPVGVAWSNQLAQTAALAHIDTISLLATNCLHHSD
jgi:hypothetical protein